MKASYRHGVEWIAMNDEPTCLENDDVAYQISTLLLADLFGKAPESVARDIIAFRVRAAKEGLR